MHEEGLLVFIWAKPGAAQNRAPKLVQRDEKHQTIEVAVNAPPEDGKANKAICENLAKYFGLRKKDILVHKGTTSREKTILIKGNAESLAEQLRGKLQI